MTRIRQWLVTMVAFLAVGSHLCPRHPDIPPSEHIEQHTADPSVPDGDDSHIGSPGSGGGGLFVNVAEHVRVSDHVMAAVT